MNTPNPPLTGETDALSGDLRPSKLSPRPSPCPQESAIAMIGDWP